MKPHKCINKKSSTPEFCIKYWAENAEMHFLAIFVIPVWSYYQY